MSTPQDRLEHLRQQIHAERISYDEIAELQSLASHIGKDDVELLQWAGVPENSPAKLSPDDAGCYVDGHWGHYGGARMIMRANEFGYDDDEVIALASKKLATMFPNIDNVEFSDDEEQTLQDTLDDVEQWLNDHVAPEGFSFGWHDGEFYFHANEWFEQS